MDDSASIKLMVTPVFFEQLAQAFQADRLCHIVVEAGREAFLVIAIHGKRQSNILFMR